LAAALKEKIRQKREAEEAAMPFHQKMKRKIDNFVQATGDRALFCLEPDNFIRKAAIRTT
jgi:hypothetical protein